MTTPNVNVSEGLQARFDSTTTGGGAPAHLSLELLSKVLGNAGGTQGWQLGPAAPVFTYTLPTTLPLGGVSDHHTHAATGDLLSLRQQLAQQLNEIKGLREEVASIRKGRGAPPPSVPSSLGAGPIFLAALLLAISFVAIAAITLCVLGLTGALPQVLELLQGRSNAIWTIVSSAITTMICFISVVSISLYASRHVQQFKS